MFSLYFALINITMRLQSTDDKNLPSKISTSISRQSIPTRNKCLCTLNLLFLLCSSTTMWLNRAGNGIFMWKVRWSSREHERWYFFVLDLQFCACHITSLGSI